MNTSTGAGARHALRGARLRGPMAYCVLSALLLAAACAPKTTAPQPPEIAYGQDLCEACGMIVDDAHFAAATLTLDGKAHKFDDVGEMIAYHMDHPEAQVQAWFVHDYRTQAWLRGEGAFFVKDTRLATPMGHGIAAFETREAAEAFAADRGGDVLAFDELRAQMHMALHGS